MTDEDEQFFQEVVRILNKKKPGSKAILHGSSGVSMEIVRHWDRSLENLERTHNIQVTFMYGSTRKLFNSIEILTK